MLSNIFRLTRLSSFKLHIFSNEICTLENVGPMSKIKKKASQFHSQVHIYESDFGMVALLGMKDFPWRGLVLPSVVLWNGMVFVKICFGWGDRRPRP